MSTAVLPPERNAMPRFIKWLLGILVGGLLTGNAFLITTLWAQGARTERVSVLESRVTGLEARLDRIENKIDRITEAVQARR